jgi:hypothetical protein
MLMAAVESLGIVSVKVSKTSEEITVGSLGQEEGEFGRGRQARMKDRGR